MSDETNTPVGSDLVQCDGFLPENEVHVWYADLTSGEGASSSLSDLLDSSEQQRASRFLVPAPRTQFVLSRVFLRIALSRYLQVDPRDVNFRIAEQGKPELAGNSGLRFNLSHTDGAAVVAVTYAGRVGVDVERIRENLDPVELADRFFSPPEAQWLRSQPAAHRFSAFFACWTAKEAFIKACGAGLSMDLAGFGVIPGAGNTELHLKIYDNPELARNWSIWQLELGPSLRGALAVEAKNLTVRLGEWSFWDRKNEPLTNR